MRDFRGTSFVSAVQKKLFQSLLFVLAGGGDPILFQLVPRWHPVAGTGNDQPFQQRHQKTTGRVRHPRLVPFVNRFVTIDHDPFFQKFKSQVTQIIVVATHTTAHCLQHVVGNVVVDGIIASTVLAFGRGVFATRHCSVQTRHHQIIHQCFQRREGQDSAAATPLVDYPVLVVDRFHVLVIHHWQLIVDGTSARQSYDRVHKRQS